MKPRPMKKILIIKMSAIGDLFISMPHMDAILAHHPNDQVWLLTSGLFIDFFARHPRLSAVALDRSRWLSAQSVFGRILWMRKNKFHAVYDLQGNRISRRLTRFSGADIRVGTQPAGVYHFHPKEPYTQKTARHVVNRLDETLASAGLAPSTPGFEAWPSNADQEMVERWKAERGISDNGYAIIHPGSSKGWESKRWPEDHYKKLALMIEERGMTCVWVGGDEDRELNASLSKTAGIDATNVFSLMQLYLFGKTARFMVGSDSAPMHIVSAGGAPAYGFFGPTSWIKNHGAGQQDRVVKNDAPCSPCFSGTCPSDKKHQCLDPIDPGDVFGKIDDELGLPSA